jgi:alkylation response protein AidB-like acyl-CoA dehydrogenase
MPVPTSPLEVARELFNQLDANSRLTPPGEPVPRASMDLLIDAGLLGLMVPRGVGGIELALPDIVDVYEEVSRANGSLGWCYFAADCTAAYFGAYLDDAGVETVFKDGVPLMAGQFAPNGTATSDRDELVINGDYQFGSGIAHAAWVGAGVLTNMEEDTDTEYLFACFPAANADLLGNWDVLGLRATASYDYTLRDVHVPRHQAFNFFEPTVHRGGPLYALGVLPLTAAGHAGWALGVTRRVLDEVASIATSTTRLGATSSLSANERFLYEFGVLEGRFRAGRAWVREACTAAEAEATRDGAISAFTASLLREACRKVNQDGADIARQAYLLAGTRALRDGPIQEGFRDLHAGSQHYFASPAGAIEFATSLLAKVEPDESD